jgi:hypothetical protein
MSLSCDAHALQPGVILQPMIDLDPDRELTLSFFPDGQQWAVRLDEFNLAGTGATKDDAVRSLAESFTAYMGRGVLEHASPVSRKQLLLEKGSKKAIEQMRIKDLLAKA